MAHPWTSEDVVGTADGLGVSPLEWQAGDILVQRYRFDCPKGATLWLCTGTYWPDTMERWALADVPGADALFVALEEE